MAGRKISPVLKTLKRDQGKLEQAMLDRQARKHALEARLSTPLPAQEIGELGLELKQVDEELAGFEERWLALSEQIEAEEAWVALIPVQGSILTLSIRHSRAAASSISDSASCMH